MNKDLIIFSITRRIGTRLGTLEEDRWVKKIANGMTETHFLGAYYVLGASYLLFWFHFHNSSMFWERERLRIKNFTQVHAASK